MGTNVWLNVWTNQTLGNSTDPHWRNVYLGVYGVFGFTQALSVMILSISLMLSTLTASKKMHKNMLFQVMKSPMSFFDTTPIGRIVNRFVNQYKFDRFLTSSMLTQLYIEEDLL